MWNRTTALLALAVIASVAVGGEIYRWTDETGRVHYGDSVPEPRKSSVRIIRSGDSAADVSPHQAPESRLANDKAMKRDKDAPSGPPNLSRAPVDSPPIAKTKTNDSCAEQWRKYLDSMECFGPYKLVNGGVKAEAFQHCVEVKQPAVCE